MTHIVTHHPNAKSLHTHKWERKKRYFHKYAMTWRDRYVEIKCKLWVPLFWHKHDILFDIILLYFKWTSNHTLHTIYRHKWLEEILTFLYMSALDKHHQTSSTYECWGLILGAKKGHNLNTFWGGNQKTFQNVTHCKMKNSF